MAENHQDNNKPMASSSQAKRRTVYGTNVAIAIIAAAALAIFFNWIVHREYEQVPPSVKGWVRYDLTATRRYSLSQQTKQVLSSLNKDYKIVTLFTSKTTQLQRVDDLVDSYAPYSSHIAVEHINPSLDVVKVQALYGKLLKRYSQDLKPMRTAIKQGQKTIKQVSGEMSGMSVPLGEAIKNTEFTDAKLKKFVQRVAALLVQEQNQLQSVNKQVDTLLSRSLPDYSQVKSSIESMLSGLNTGLLQPAAAKFKQTVDANSLAGVPASVQNALLNSADAMQKVEKTIQDAVAKLKSAKPVDSYSKLRKGLLASQSVVVMGPDQVRLVPVSAMYRQPTARQVNQGGNHESLFLGEAKLTGALISMTLKTPPMVVFINMGPSSAIGPRGQYQAVASRLQASNLDVVQWNASAKKGRLGRPMPPQPAPKPDKGQKAIWVVLPAPPRAMMGMRRGGGPAKKVAEHLKQRMKKGDSVMMMLGVNPGSKFGAPNPLVKMLKPWGIVPKLDRVIMTQVQRAGSPPQAIMQMTVTHWPKDTAISRALNGLPGMMFETSPIELVQPKKGKVQQWPLVTLTGDRLWTINNFMSKKAIQNAKYDKSKSESSYTIGVAAEKNGQRLVVITGPLWAQNRIVNYGRLGPGTASLTGAVFPGNGELFVNSIYWLGGLDKLIATSPQVQEIRRIQPMSYASLIGYRVFLLAGLPIIVLAIGIGVWTARRRG